MLLVVSPAWSLLPHWATHQVQGERLGISGVREGALHYSARRTPSNEEAHRSSQMGSEGMLLALG